MRMGLSRARERTSAGSLLDEQAEEKYALHAHLLYLFLCRFARVDYQFLWSLSVQGMDTVRQTLHRGPWDKRL